MNLIEELEDVGRELHHDASTPLHAAAGVVEKHLTEHPQPGFALLRPVKPILIIHGIAVVTRYDDVTEVLGHDEAFSSSPTATRCAALPGTSSSAPMTRPSTSATSRSCAWPPPRSDVLALRDFVEQTAEGLVDASVGRLDVPDLAKRVPTRLMGCWFGTRVPMRTP